MPAVSRDSDRYDRNGHDLDREVCEVVCRGRPIEEQPEGSGDSDSSDCEAGHEKPGQAPLSPASTPEEKAAEADLKPPIEGADLGETTRGGRPPRLLSERCGRGEGRETRDQHEESQEDEDAAVE
jgi:hypothetical protein